MSVVTSFAPQPANMLVRMLAGEVKVVGKLPEGPVLLCGNHNSYRDVFLFGMIRSSTRTQVLMRASTPNRRLLGNQENAQGEGTESA